MSRSVRAMRTSTSTRRLAFAAAVTLALAGGACSSDDSEDDAGDGGAPSSTAAASTTDGADEGGDETADGATDGESDSEDGESGGSGNPCSVVTQEQWETLFGAGVTKADGSGSADNCNILTSGSSPGHEISLTNLSASRETAFEDELTNNPGCGGAAIELEGVGDQAVIDTSCLAMSGRAWVIAEVGGDVLLMSFDAGEPTDVDTATFTETFTVIATDMVAAR